MPSISMKNVLALAAAWRPALSFALLAGGVAAAANGQVGNRVSVDNKATHIDALFRTASSRGGGYLVSYRANGKTVTKGYGSLDCAGRKAMRKDALFDSGSLTKLFTNAAIYKLVEQRRLKLDDSLDEVFRGVPADKRAITVDQILSHRSGIANFVGPNGRVVPQSEWTPETYDYAPVSKTELLMRAWKAPLRFAPGTDEAYSNTGFNVLAAIVEQVSGQSYETYVREHVLLPLGMTSTGYLPLSAPPRPIVEQCGNGGVPWGDPFNRGFYKAGVSWNIMGNGGMMTTLEDLDKWSAGIEGAKLLRADLQARFDRTLYGRSYRCRTEATALGGSNRMTSSLILHMPRRREVLISVATQADHGLPPEESMMAVLCPR